MKENQPENIHSLLDEMASIPTMERGKLTAEYRTRPSQDGSGTVRLGPYYKYQVWENGRNVTRRVPAEQAGVLEGDIANYNHFNELSATFAQTVIKRTRALREQSLGAVDADDTADKKNSTKKRASKSFAKPKPSSRKPKRS
jgi:hypothetical protein